MSQNLLTIVAKPNNYLLEALNKTGHNSCKINSAYDCLCSLSIDLCFFQIPVSFLYSTLTGLHQQSPGVAGVLDQLWMLFCVWAERI